MMYLFTLLLCSLLTFVTPQCHSGYCEDQLPSICPKIIDRKAWGARKAEDVVYATIPVNYAIIHHTATQNCVTSDECITIIRSIQNYHLDELDFGHIGYNFLIGGDGNVYEGCGWHRVGAHTYKFNKYSIGIAFIGNYMAEYPTRKQLDQAKDLISCAVKLGELDPDYKLYGGKQLISTSSPGKKLYNEIKTWPNWSQEIPKDLR